MNLFKVPKLCIIVSVISFAHALVIPIMSSKIDTNIYIIIGLLSLGIGTGVKVSLIMTKNKNKSQNRKINPPSN